MVAELDSVVLTRDIPQHHLKAGDIGTVVMVHDGGAGFEVEFTTLSGHTVAVITAPFDAVRSADAGEIAHVRRVA